MGVKKVGIAFCIGLANEAHFCAQYFKNEGLDVQSVCCKVCSVDKDLLELEKIKPGQREAMCNPKVQARLLNEGGTELKFYRRALRRSRYAFYHGIQSAGFQYNY